MGGSEHAKTESKNSGVTHCSKRGLGAQWAERLQEVKGKKKEKKKVAPWEGGQHPRDRDREFGAGWTEREERDVRSEEHTSELQSP